MSAYWYFFTFHPGTRPLHDANEEIEWRNAYASNPDNPYDPNIYAYEASRGELRDCYFGIRLDDLEKDQDGNYVMSEAQRDTLIKNLSGKHMCSLQWISWTHFGKSRLPLMAPEP